MVGPTEYLLAGWVSCDASLLIVFGTVDSADVKLCEQAKYSIWFTWETRSAIHSFLHYALDLVEVKRKWQCGPLGIKNKIKNLLEKIPVLERNLKINLSPTIPFERKWESHGYWAGRGNKPGHCCSPWTNCPVLQHLRNSSFSSAWSHSLLPSWNIREDREIVSLRGKG